MASRVASQSVHLYIIGHLWFQVQTFIRYFAVLHLLHVMKIQCCPTAFCINLSRK